MFYVLSTTASKISDLYNLDSFKSQFMNIWVFIQSFIDLLIQIHILFISCVHYKNTAKNIDSVSIISKTKPLCIILLLILENTLIGLAYANKYNMCSLVPKT